MITKILTPERIQQYLSEEQDQPAKPAEGLSHIHHLTVGDLRKAIADLPDEMPVAYQRIEDHYFDNNGWSVVVGVWENWGDHRTRITDYIVAWDAYPIETHLEKMFVINAHY